jgi:CheY-like chemotaxis protein
VDPLILVAEDDEWVRDTLAMLLESEGYEVALAADGLQALAELQRRRPALILLDLMMPRMDGYAVVAEMEQRGFRPGVPVLLLTAARDPEQIAQRLRAEGYVPKPFDIDQLLHEIERVLAGNP